MKEFEFLKQTTNIVPKTLLYPIYFQFHSVQEKKRQNTTDNTECMNRITSKYGIKLPFIMHSVRKRKREREHKAELKWMPLLLFCNNASLFIQFSAYFIHIKWTPLPCLWFVWTKTWTANQAERWRLCCFYWVFFFTS